MGAKGGKTKGSAKARTSRQARLAVMTRWNKQKKKFASAKTKEGRAL